MALNYHQLPHFLHGRGAGKLFGGGPSAPYDAAGGNDANPSAGGLFRLQAAGQIDEKIELTEAGQTLLPFARKSVEMIRETEQAMSRYTSMLEGRLQLGASLTIGEYVLPRLLGPFGQRYPHISIVMKVMNTTQIIEEIVGHQAQFRACRGARPAPGYGIGAGHGG